MAPEHEEKHTVDEWMDMLQTRLCEYEETGMTPEEAEYTKLYAMGKAVAEIEEFEGVPINRLKELALADKEGRVVIIPAPAKEGDPKPSCFYNDYGGIWCNGKSNSYEDDEPTERCKNCWYCEHGYAAEDGDR